MIVSRVKGFDKNHSYKIVNTTSLSGGFT